ncbi:uncharacterized protein AKAME5_002284700 [Lates japonicus]|uniref:Uncharacterized protein n=1 Tax=Lates japonicus TaxID=270547 RepID=A0AAD3NGV5_LATJO|nr:uncharacterized protein AKAME5_002284700 [Lates japonicus]
MKQQMEELEQVATNKLHCLDEETERPTAEQTGLLCGAGSAAELLTRHQILLEPVMKVMEEVITALGHITGEDLLHTEVKVMSLLFNKPLYRDFMMGASHLDNMCFLSPQLNDMRNCS